VHTDEFEISLSRELAVCRKAIKKIEKSLSLMEKKYGGETKNLPGPSGRADAQDILQLHQELDQWRSTLRQYEELYYSMKI
jgi:hypothetical protein